MVWWLLFAVFLYIVCAALIVAEVFIPSGGLLSIAALAALVGGVATFFHYSPIAGWIGIVVALIMVPLLLVGAYRVLPMTRFGRQVILSPAARERGDAISDTANLVELLGQAGEVLTPLRPVGTCAFGKTRVECVAESGYIQKGKTVKVIRVEGTQLTVRATDDA